MWGNWVALGFHIWWAGSPIHARDHWWSVSEGVAGEMIVLVSRVWFRTHHQIRSVALLLLVLFLRIGIAITSVLADHALDVHKCFLIQFFSSLTLFTLERREDWLFACLICESLHVSFYILDLVCKVCITCAWVFVLFLPFKALDFEVVDLALVLLLFFFHCEVLLSESSQFTLELVEFLVEFVQLHIMSPPVVL